MSRTHVTLVFALAAFAAPAAPRAATAQRRRGAQTESFWVAGGLGATWLRASCSICARDRGTGVSVYGGLGGTAGRRVLIGAEAAGRFKRDGDIRERVWSFGAVTYWYPDARRRLFWKLGAGVLLYRIDDGQDVLTAAPFGLQLGAGYETPLDRRLWLVPSASLHVASWGGGLKFNGADAVGDFGLTMLQLSLGVKRR
jgi:hypothetical protein